MAGAIAIGVALVLVVPVAVMIGGAVWSTLFGWLSSEEAAERAHCE